MQKIKLPGKGKLGQRGKCVSSAKIKGKNRKREPKVAKMQNGEMDKLGGPWTGKKRSL